MSSSSNMRVLVVDDTESNVDILVDTLADDYRVSVAMDGESALDAVKRKQPDLILLDIMMPGIDGYDVCERLKADEKTKNIPVVFLTALAEECNEAKGLALGAVDYITKPFCADLVKARVHNHLQLKRHRDQLEDIVQERTRQLLLTQEVTIESMGTLAEFRDPETGGHIKRTRNYVRRMAEHLYEQKKFTDFLTPEIIELLYKSAPLHDIGKVGVPDNILLKSGKLSPEEFEIMKKHTTYGQEAIKVSERKLGHDSFLQLARVIAYTHHERWDGTGYPQGLSGESIPVAGHIMAVCDVYDALVSKRLYKPPFSHKKAVSIITEGKGKHFNPVLVDAFLNVAEDFRQIALEFSDYEEERQALKV